MGTAKPLHDKGDSVQKKSFRVRQALEAADQVILISRRDKQLSEVIIAKESDGPPRFVTSWDLFRVARKLVIRDLQELWSAFKRDMAEVWKSEPYEGLDL